MNLPTVTSFNFRCTGAIPATLLCSASILLSAAAQATQPPDNVVSDSGADTAMGTSALAGLTTGYQNTASGESAMQFNQGGFKNTASGYSALQHNTSGNDNAAFGSGALDKNTTANDNAAFGMDALYNNQTSGENSAVGSHALYSNTEVDNSAVGYYALYSNTVGYQNSAFGAYALESNVSGIDNTAVGFDSMIHSTGDSNTAVGFNSLENARGGANIAIGYSAGYSLVNGNENIYLGNGGLSSESGSIRIGTKGLQSAAYIAGVATTKVTGAAVYITAAGQLGVLASSERYKTQIKPLVFDTDRLQRLRPVSYHLKTDPAGAVQYGLIAEQVDKVYPELVIRDDAGQIQGVRYEELAPMLLSVVQRQAREIDSLKAQTESLRAQTSKLGQMERQLNEMRTAMQLLPGRDEIVARR